MRCGRLKVARYRKQASTKCKKLISLANLIQQRLVTTRRCRLTMTIKDSITLEMIVN